MGKKKTSGAKAAKKAAKKQKRADKVAKRDAKGKKFVNKIKNTKAVKKVLNNKTVKKAANSKLGKKVISKTKSLVHQITHPMETVKNVAKNLKDDAKFIALAPFKIPMLLALKQKHVEVNKKASLKTIAALFYVNVIAKERLEHLMHLEHADESAAEDLAWKAASDIASNSGVPAAGIVTTIIHKVVDYFKAKKKAKKEREVREKAEADGKDPDEAVSKEIPEEERMTPDEKELAGDPKNPKEPLDDAIDAQIDKSVDVIAKETGGEDSKGNTHPAPEPTPEEKAEAKANGEEDKDEKLKTNSKGEDTSLRAPHRRFGFLSFYGH